MAGAVSLVSAAQLPTAFLSRRAAAAGIALIAAVGNPLGGFAGPAFTGVTEDSTGGFEVPLAALVGLVVVGPLTTFAHEEPVSVPEPSPCLSPDLSLAD